MLFVLTVAFISRAYIHPEDAFDVLVAADMLSLPRLIQIAEFALQPVRLSYHRQGQVCGHPILAQHRQLLRAVRHRCEA